MKLIKHGEHFLIVADYNTGEAYDTRIKKGTWFYKDDLKDIVFAEYSPASKVSRPILSSDYIAGLPMLDRNAEFKYYDCWINLNNLSVKDEVDVIRLAEIYIREGKDFEGEGFSDYQNGKHNGYSDGYAQCLTDNLGKDFREKDMAAFGQYCIRQYKLFTNNDSNFAERLLPDFLSSRQQTEWDVTVDANSPDGLMTIIEVK